MFVMFVMLSCTCYCMSFKAINWDNYPTSKVFPRWWSPLVVEPPFPESWLRLCITSLDDLVFLPFICLNSNIVDSGFSCGNHQPKIFLKYQTFCQLAAAFATDGGSSKLPKRLVFQRKSLVGDFHKRPLSDATQPDKLLQLYSRLYNWRVILGRYM